MTSRFVYKVMGLTFHDRINTQLIYKIEIAQMVARRNTKPQRTFSRFESHWLLFLFIFLLFFFLEEGGSDFILFMSYFFSFYLFFIIFYPFDMYKEHIKNFCNNTSYCKFGNTRECER